MRTSHSTNKQSKNARQKKRVFTKYMQEKLAITVIVIMLALFALIYVLYDLVNKNQDKYNQIVLNQQEYGSRVIPYRRGDIVDRNGTVLATTDKVYNLIIDPKQIMSSSEDYLETTVTALNRAYGYDAAEIRTLVTDNATSAYIRYARQMTLEQKEAFEAVEKEINDANRKAGSKGRTRGVWFEEEYKRVYPHQDVASHVIGFATSDGGNGTGGIEQFYNSTLVGTNGREYGYLNSDSNLERVIKSANNGNTVVSTIDVNIQKIVEKYIDEWQAEPGADRVGVIVMNPNNGEVLAMASDQKFDLNNPRDVSGQYTSQELMTLGEKEAVDTHNRKNPDNKITTEQVYSHYTNDEIMSYGQQVAWNQVWRNFCISDTYEPGSPSKIFTVSAGLEEGVLTGDESFECDGFQNVGGHTIKCVRKTGHGWLTVPESLMVSCNDAMMQMGARIGRERFGKYQETFGFGSKTGIDLPGEADTSNLIYTAENMGASDLATNAFGQNYNCTMIQMAAAYSSVINGGSYFEPHVVKQVLNEQGSIIKKNDAVLVRETVSEGTSNFINETLLRTVNEGTGKAAAVVGYDIAGKTGTAEKYPRGQGNYLVSFCGYAPAHNPEVLVYVIIDTPHVADQPHSSFASGVFQEIMTDILPYMNIFPNVDSEEAEDEIAAGLPEEEGINSNNETPETEPAKEYQTEEYVEPDVEQDSGIPANLPGGADGETQAVSNILHIEIETTPVQTTAAQTAAGQTTAGQTGGSGTTAATTAAKTTAAETGTTAAATTAARTKAATAAATTAETRAAAAETTTAGQTERRQTEAESEEPGQIHIVEPRE